MPGFYLGFQFGGCFFPQFFAFRERPGSAYPASVIVPYIQPRLCASEEFCFYSGDQNRQDGRFRRRMRPQENHRQNMFRVSRFPEVCIDSYQSVVSEFVSFLLKFAVAQHLQAVRPREFRFYLPLEIVF